MELGRNEIVDELAKRCGFYKKYVKKFLDEFVNKLPNNNLTYKICEEKPLTDEEYV